MGRTLSEDVRRQRLDREVQGLPGDDLQFRGLGFLALDGDEVPWFS
jgi:hypothetical protein